MDQVPTAKRYQEETIQKSQTETEKRIGFSILFGLGGKYILFDFSEKGGKKICNRTCVVVKSS